MNRVWKRAFMETFTHSPRCSRWRSVRSPSTSERLHLKKVRREDGTLVTFHPHSGGEKEPFRSRNPRHWSWLSCFVLLPGSHHFPLTLWKRNTPLGHCFNTSKQSNYQCYYLGSIVMELTLWQIAAIFSDVRFYSGSCVSSDRPPISAWRSPPSVLLCHASIVTPPLLLQSISRSNCHALAPYPNPITSR